MALKKQELEDLFQNLSEGLSSTIISQILKPTGRGGVYASRDYIQANCLLAEYKKATSTPLSQITEVSQLYKALHPCTQFRLRYFTPCLAFRYDAWQNKKDPSKMSPKQHQFFNDPNWVFTEKENGCRGWLLCHPDGTVHLYSRNYSDKDCSLLEYWNNIDQTVSPHDDIVAIDVEIKFEPGVSISEELSDLGLTTDSPLEAMTALLHTYPESAQAIQQKYRAKYNEELITLRMIHPLYYKGVNYVTKQLGAGMDVYDECLQYVNSLGVNVKPIARCNGTQEEKEIFLNSIIQRGGEGIVGHYRLGSYCTSENRSDTSYVKLKRTISATETGLGLGDTIDCFVTGFKMGSNGTQNEGLISALEMSIYVNDEGKCYQHHIASIPNLEKTMKEAITWNNADGSYPQEITLSDGTTRWVSLNPEFDHLVAECSGQALSSKSMRLEHPRCLRWRPERDPGSCIYTKSWLLSQTTNVGINY